MHFYFRSEKFLFSLQIEAATLGAFAQGAIWTISKYLGWL